MASSSSSSPTPSADMRAPPATPSHFDTLPTELLKQIVVFVHRQDQKLLQSSVRRSSTRPCTKEVVYDDDDGESDLEEIRAEPGAFSWWYGRGIYALSLLNRRLRELCFPWLLPIAKPAHFGSSLFTFGRIPQAILDGIERIDLSDSSETDFIATAAALPKLKNVSKLELFVDGRLPTSSQYERRDGVSAAGRQARQLAKEAFKAASSQFQCLMIHDAGYGAFDLNSISAFANADSLRRLSVRNFGRSLFTAVYGVPAAPLRKLATNYPALTYLDLTGTDSVDFGVLTRNVPWKEAEHFSSLQVFLVRATATSVFDFAQSTMPKLEALKVTFTNRYWAPDELSATWTLPSLKRVQIRGPSEFTTFLAQLQLPVLQKIEIAIVSAEGRAVDCSKLFTTDTLLPQNVVLHLTFDRRLRIEHADAVVQWCEKHQIRLFRFSCNIFAPYTGRMNRLDDDEALERQADAIEAALCWAAERKDRLLQFKDAAGLQELAELVKPLYEREYIEGM